MTVPGTPAPTSPAAPAPGVARRTKRGFVDSYGEGRSCATAGCATVLSQYNPNSRCSHHDQVDHPTLDR